MKHYFEFYYTPGVFHVPPEPLLIQGSQEFSKANSAVVLN